MKDVKIIGLEDVLEKAKKYAATDVPILITGEPGVGKGVVAKFIHANSLRAKMIFNPLNCGAANGLVDSELFGHRKGSFTDARSDRPGRLLTSAGGTVFLDEIGDMPRSVQAKILRFLDGDTKGEIQQIGADRPVYVDARIICATNQLLRKMVSEKTFRRDLYSRICGFEIYIPPLRERKDEIPLFVEHFFDYFTEKYQKKWCRDFIVSRLTELAMEMLWQGNVRELMGWVEKFVILEDLETNKKEVRIVRSVPDDATGKCIIIPEKEFSVLPEEVGFEKIPVEGGFVNGECFVPNCASGDFQPLSLAQIDFLLVSNNKNDQDEFKLEKSFLECEDEEKERILREVINRAGGNVNEASRMLEMSASTVHLYIKKLDFSSFVKEERSKAKRKF
jgi:transcriptional regulator with GAF, ATPase, and Fis domain